MKQLDWLIELQLCMKVKLYRSVVQRNSITNPSNDYVAEFTKDIPRAKLLSVGSIMKTTKNLRESTLKVNKKRQNFYSEAPKIISSNSVATVVDDNGEVCGELTKDQIIEILFRDKENHE